MDGLEVLTLDQAARRLGKSPCTVRRWIAKGAPTVSLGKEGRGNGSLVDLDQVRRWRAGIAGLDIQPPGETDSLQRLATALWDVFKRDAGVGDGGYPAHRLLGIRDYQAAALLVEVYERHAQDLTGSIPDPLPTEIQLLVSLVRQTAHK